MINKIEDREPGTECTIIKNRTIIYNKQLNTVK